MKQVGDCVIQGVQVCSPQGSEVVEYNPLHGPYQDEEAALGGGDVDWRRVERCEKCVVGAPNVLEESCVFFVSIFGVTTLCLQTSITSYR